MSTVELSKTRAATPHTAVMRRRAALVRRGRKLLRATEQLLDTQEHCAFEDADDLNVLVAQLDVLNADVSERLSSAQVEENGPTLSQLGTALVDLQNFRSEVHDHEVHERLDRLEAVEAGLAPLRWVHDPDELLAKVCEAVVHSCGFDRAMLSRVEDST